MSARFFELLDGLDPDENKRGREFELICRWFLRNAPRYRAQLREVWLWDEWPGRWGDDTGIDLVAETVGGELWAVQAKCYDQDYSVTKADVDSFLSESSRTLADGRGFAYRLLLATTDRVGATALKTMDAQAVEVGRLLRSQLAREPVDWSASPAELTRLRGRQVERAALEVA